jgi:hypothetical protein
MSSGESKMKRAVLAALFLSFAGAIATVPASADTVLYDTTSAGSGSSGGVGISARAGQISDPFTLTSNATVTGATITVWLNTYPYSGIAASLTTIDWSIGTSALGSSLGSGTDVAPASSITLTSGVHQYYDTAKDWITIPDITLAAGTYWFTLSDAVSSNDGAVSWEYANNGPNAYSNLYGQLGASETFQILGDSSGSATPEPSSFLLLGTGLMGLAGMIRSKLKTKSIFRR